MVPMGHVRARYSNAGDEHVYLVTRLRNLAEFGLRDAFIHQDVTGGRGNARGPSALHLLRLEHAQSS